MKCLDTDLLVAILRGKDKDAEEKMKRLDQEGRHGTTTLNAFELSMELIDLRVEQRISTR